MGGDREEDHDHSGAAAHQRMFERCCNAYLVFYERVHPLDKEEDMRRVGVEQRDELFEKIHKQNLAFKNLKIFSDSDFIQFASDFFRLCQF